MKPKNDVFQLVRSLTKAEKRFFNLFSALSEGEKNYVKLFNALDKMSEYDEKKLKKKLAGERFLNNLSYEKNYLFKMLLRSLRIFHDESDSDNALHSRIIDINILTEKGLYNASRETLKKAMAIAGTHKKYELQIALLKLETDLDDRLYDIGQTTRNIEHHFTQISQHLKHIDSYNRYKKLYDSFWIYARQRREKGMEGLRKLMSTPELKKYPEDGGFYAQKFYLAIHSSFKMFEGKTAESLVYTEDLVSLIQAHPELIADQPKQYYGAVHNLLGRYIYLGEEQKFFKMLEEFREFPEKVNPIRRKFYSLKVTASSIQLELEFYLKNNLQKKALLRLPKLTTVLKEMEKEMPVEHILTLNYTAACVFFINGHCKDALRHIHRMINDENLVDQRIDLQCNARLMRICCYHDMNDTVGMELAQKDLKRTMRNEHLHFDSLKLLSSYFSKAAVMTPAQRKLELSVLEKKISALMKTSEKDHTLMSEVEILTWIRNNQ
jgi:hypothetical protein